MRLGAQQYLTVIGIMLVWWLGGSIFAGYFVQNHSQYAAAGFGSALLSALALGLINLGALAIFRSRSACVGLIIGTLCGLPFSFGFSFFAAAFGSIGGSATAASTARDIHWFVPVAMGFIAIPTNLAAFIGAALGQSAGRRRSILPPQAGVAATANPPWRPE